MKKYKNMKGHRFELKTVHFVPTHAEHERAEGKKYERMEHKMGHPVKGNPKPESFVRTQYEEKEKELEKTNKVTGLWYPHKTK